jgi:hypothetical protein
VEVLSEQRARPQECKSRKGHCVVIGASYIGMECGASVASNGIEGAPSSSVIFIPIPRREAEGHRRWNALSMRTISSVDYCRAGRTARGRVGAPTKAGWGDAHGCRSCWGVPCSHTALNGAAVFVTIASCTMWMVDAVNAVQQHRLSGVSVIAWGATLSNPA